MASPIVTTGDLISAANWNAGPLGVAARWSRATALAVADNTIVTLTGIALDFSNDEDSHFSIANGVVTVAIAGVYTISAGVRFAADPDGYRRLFIRKNSTVLNGAFSPSSSVEVRLNVTTGPVQLAANDTFDARVFHNAGNGINIDVAEFDPYLSVVKVGAT